MHFKFKQFNVRQQEGVFKVGTDALLLGAWAEVGMAKRILDVGTGTGVVALMLAQRSHAFIDAVDINAEAVTLAEQNFVASPWRERLSAHQKTLQAFSAEATAIYDLVVSNPPFFNRSLQSTSEAKNLARHTMGLSHAELLQHSAALLKSDGRMAVILPIEEGRLLIEAARLCELFLNKVTTVYPTKEKPANRLLLEFCKKEAVAAKNDLVIRAKNTTNKYGFTQQYIKLTQDYHTIF